VAVVYDSAIQEGEYGVFRWWLDPSLRSDDSFGGSSSLTDITREGSLPGGRRWPNCFLGFAFLVLKGATKASRSINAGSMAAAAAAVVGREQR
jgi:hypothetical protein